MTDTEQTPTPGLVERVARAIMLQDGCGLTIDGKHVLCCDSSVHGHNDAYGKPLFDDECSCRAFAIAAIAAMPAPDAAKDAQIAALREALEKIVTLTTYMSNAYAKEAHLRAKVALAKAQP